MINIPTLITAVRLVFVLPLVLLVQLSSPVAVWCSFILYLVLAASDWLDGYFARRFNQQTQFGAMLDQIADKILVISLFAALAAGNLIGGLTLIPVTVIILREFLVSGLREYYAQNMRPLPVGPWGKWKTTIQMIALGLLLVPYATIAHQGGVVLLWLAAGLAIMSLIGYVKANAATVPP